MPKRIVFYFIGFVVLASLAFYGFSRWKDSREKVDLWALVPESAVFVLETNNHADLVQHLRETDLWSSLMVLPFAQRFEESLAAIDSVAPGTERLSRFLDKKHILTSLHVVGKAEVSYVYYVPVNSVGELRFLRTLTENISKSGEYAEEVREYQGMVLTDVTNTRLNSHFTYFTYHNNVVISPSAVLVEEIVRRLNHDPSTTIAGDFRSINYLGQPDVYANVFINYRNLPEFLGLFLKEEVMPEVRYLTSFCQSAMLELKLEQDKIFLNGFSSPETLPNSLHQIMQPRKPQPLGMKDYLPSRTALLLHVGLQEVERLRLPRQENNSMYGNTVDSLAQSLSEEGAIAYMESASINASPEKVAYMHMADPEVSMQLLQRLSGQLASARKQRPVKEQYGNYAIELLNVPELPAQLLGRLFKGFEQSYVVQVDDYLLFAERITTLRTLLNDLAEENVWAKSAVQKAFLEQTLQEANLSVYLNTVNAWYILNRYVEDADRENLLQNASLIKRFSQVSLQLAKVDQQYYTSLVIRKPDRSNSGTRQDVFLTEKALTFDNRLESRPFPVQNATDRSREVLVQDSAGVIFSVTANNEMAWADSVGAFVRGGIQQVEAAGDAKKLQYFFATSNRIYALDEQGRDVENFPFNMADSLNMQHLAVFRYENDDRHRLLVDDAMGNLYMYDSRGAAVQGWQPRRMDYRLATAPRYLRISGRDVILVVLENGYIYALNRQGDTYPGFPVSLKSPVTSGLAVNVGPDLRRTTLTAATRYGSVVTMNLQGKVLNREQLERPSKRALFELVPESSNGRSSVIVRQEQGKVTLFDQDLNELFQKRYITSAPKIVQYFDFGGGNRVYAITETGPQKTYLYDSEGNLIGNRILESSGPVTIHYNESSDTYTLSKAYRNELKQIEFRIPD